MVMLHQKVAPCWGWVKREGGRRGNWGSKRMLALQFVAAPWQVIVIVSQSAPRLTDCPTKCHAVIAPRAKSQFQLDAAAATAATSCLVTASICHWAAAVLCLECIAVAPELCLVEHSKLHRESAPAPTLFTSLRALQPAPCGSSSMHFADYLSSICYTLQLSSIGSVREELEGKKELLERTSYTDL